VHFKAVTTFLKKIKVLEKFEGRTIEVQTLGCE